MKTANMSDSLIQETQKGKYGQQQQGMQKVAQCDVLFRGHGARDIDRRAWRAPS